MSVNGLGGLTSNRRGSAMTMSCAAAGAAIVIPETLEWHDGFTLRDIHRANWADLSTIAKKKWSRSTRLRQARELVLALSSNHSIREEWGETEQNLPDQPQNLSNVSATTKRGFVGFVGHPEM